MSDVTPVDATPPTGADEPPVGEDERHDHVSEEVNPSAGAAVAHASRQEDPTDRAEALGAGLGEHATGDILIDAALQDLQSAAGEDLDAQIDAGQRVHQTLQARLSDLGGE